MQAVAKVRGIRAFQPALGFVQRAQCRNERALIGSARQGKQLLELVNHQQQSLRWRMLAEERDHRTRELCHVSADRCRQRFQWMGAKSDGLHEPESWWKKETLMQARQQSCVFVDVEVLQPGYQLVQRWIVIDDVEYAARISARTMNSKWVPSAITRSDRD